MTIESFLNEPQYFEFLININSELKKHARSEIVLDLIPEKFCLDMAKEFLEIAHVTITDIRNLLQTNQHSAAIYVAKKMEKYQTAETDAKADEMVKYQPASRVMPIGHLIEFLLIKSNDDILKYLNHIGIPGAKKYEKEIKKIYHISLQKM